MMMLSKLSLFQRQQQGQGQCNIHVTRGNPANGRQPIFFVSLPLLEFQPQGQSCGLESAAAIAPSVKLFLFVKRSRI